MPGASEFIERTLYLEGQVGDGFITAGCLVDQPYAQEQHENLSLNHNRSDRGHAPAGGRAKYLGAPLMENSFRTMNEIARRTITKAGSELKEAMIDFSETMAQDYVGREAPVLTQDLRNSGEPWVDDGGIEIYRRPANAPRDNTSERGWEDRPPEEYE